MTVSGAPAAKPSRQVARSEPIELLGPPPKYVSRAGLKLEGALEEFDIDPRGRHGLDVGSSTGGFTDCLLQAGAASVVALDVGRHQLHERLRADDRVVSMEHTHIRDVSIETFADDERRRDGFGIVVVDLSFISTTSLLGHLAQFFGPDADGVALIKPQFEAGRTEVSRGSGIIRDRDVWVRVLHAFIDAAVDAGLEVVDLAISPITGGKGNVEFLGHVRRADILGGVNGPDAEIAR